MTSQETPTRPAFQPDPPRARPVRYYTPVLVLLGMLLLTLLAAGYVLRTTRSEAKMRYDNDVQNARREVIDAVQFRLSRGAALLHASAGIFAFNDDPTAQQFRPYVEQIALVRDYPGVLGVAFTRRKFEGDNFPLVYMNAQDRRNRVTILHDDAGDDTRHFAMEHSRDTGRPYATGKITLVRENDADPQPGFVMYRPVYRGGVIPATVELRRRDLIGWVYVPFRINHLLEQIGHGEPLAVTFEVFDGVEPTPQQQLFRSAAPAPTRALALPDQRATVTLPVEGRTWSIVFAPRERFSALTGVIATAVTLIGGFGLSLIFFLAISAQARARGSAESSARRLSRSEAALRESEQRFRTMADTAPVLIWTADPRGQRTYFNKPWLDYTGRTMAQHVGEGWMESVHPDDRPHWLEVYAEAYRKREPFEIDYRLRRQDGEYRWVLAHGAPQSADDGTFEGFIGVCIDHTERKQAQEEERAARARAETLARDAEALARSAEALASDAEAARQAAEAANRSKDEFVATLSHELRTPLNAILGWAQLLRAGSVEGEEVQQGLDTIERNARAQAQLVDDLLDLSRIISGKLRLDVKPVDLPGVIEAALETVQPASAAREINVIPVLDAHAGVVLGDAGRLQQVVWNLLSNAIKFTPRGGQVQVLLRRVENSAEITISDNGQGISPEFLPHVFERLRQADSSSTRRHGGLGLGLSIVRHLVELHGGTVRAESRGVGEGAAFTVNLPLSRRRAIAGWRQRQPQAADDDGDEAAAELCLRGLRILVVDDEADARDLLTKILTLRGAEVTVSASAAEALDVLPREQPDVLLSDISMPHEDGYTLIGKVRALSIEQGGRIPAAALTAFARKDDHRRALEAGFQVHLAKPVEPEDLARVVAKLAGRPEQAPT